MAGGAPLVRAFAALVVRWRLSAREADAVLAVGQGVAARVVALEASPSKRAMSRVMIAAAIDRRMASLGHGSAMCARWVRRPHPELGGATPLALLGDPSDGAERVAAILGIGVRPDGTALR